MALAETPEALNERRQRRLEQEAHRRENPAPPEAEDSVDPFASSELSEGLQRGASKHGEARDASHPAVRQLRMILRGWHVRGYTQVLNVLEVVSPTDRAFERARKQVLDVMNAQERLMVEILNRHAGPPQAKGKETNGEG